MSLRRVSLPASVPGSLWLGPMPGRFDSWEAFEAQAQQARLSLVVCLTPREELVELSPKYQAALAGGGLGFEWLNLPMPNYGVPEDEPGFRREVIRIASALQSGEVVMLHCAAGIGRTGTVAACVLKSLGQPSSVALQAVRNAGSNPENALQSGLVEWF